MRQATHPPFLHRAVRSIARERSTPPTATATHDADDRADIADATTHSTATSAMALAVIFARGSATYDDAWSATTTLIATSAGAFIASAVST